MSGASRHAAGASPAAGVSSLAARSRACARAFLRARFVEAVLTCFSDLRVALEERFVEPRPRPRPRRLALARPDDDVVYPAVPDEARRVRRALVDAPQLGLARAVVRPVRPE